MVESPSSIIPLYAHQELGVRRIDELNGCAGIFAEMATGKTRLVLAWLARRKVARVVVEAPLTAASVWKQENINCGEPFKLLQLTGGSVKDRAKILKTLNTDRPTMLIFNYDVPWREPLRTQLLRWLDADPFSAAVLDEGDFIKNRSSKRSRFAYLLGQRVKYKLLLTGTPITGGLEDLFAMYRFIDPSVFGVRWADFAWRYLKFGGYLGHEIVDYRNVEEFKTKVDATSFQCAKSDVLDLPDRIDIPIVIQLTGKARKAYDAMRKTAIAEIKNGEQSGTSIARIAATIMIRLQQITGGWANTDTGIIDFVEQEKLAACKELIEQCQRERHRVLVFCRFLHDLDLLQEAIPSAYQLRGGQTALDREQILTQYEQDPKGVLLSQITVGGRGLNLQHSTHIEIFYSPTFSLPDFMQAKDRIHRPGQTENCVYYHLLCEKTVDEKVYATLAKKKNVAKMLLDLDYVNDLLSFEADLPQPTLLEEFGVETKKESKELSIWTTT